MAAAHDGDGTLRRHRHMERVRERAVDGDTRDGRQRPHRVPDRSGVDLEQAPADRALRCLSNLALDRRRRADDLDTLDCEDGAGARAPVGGEHACGDERDDGERAAGGDETGEVQAIADGALRKRDDGACRARPPARSAPGSSPGHAG